MDRIESRNKRKEKRQEPRETGRKVKAHELDGCSDVGFVFALSLAVEVGESRWSGFVGVKGDGRVAGSHLRRRREEEEEEEERAGTLVRGKIAGGKEASIKIIGD